MKDNLKILIVDDHILVLEGFARVLGEMEIVAEVVAAHSGEEALETISSGKDIDLLITDIEMEGMSGIELLTRVKAGHPQVKVLVLTMHSNAGFIREVVRLNADGYVLKSADKAELELAIRSISTGKKHFEHSVMRELAADVTSNSASNKLLRTLTDREREILTLIAQGYSNKAIAEKLNVAVKTVDSHRTNLMQKLDIHNTAGLTRLAIQEKLI